MVQEKIEIKTNEVSFHIWQIWIKDIQQFLVLFLQLFFVWNYVKIKNKLFLKMNVLWATNNGWSNLKDEINTNTFTKIKSLEQTLALTQYWQVGVSGTQPKVLGSTVELARCC